MYLHGREVSKHFGGVPALRAVDFHVEKEEILGLIGPNGAGKTTLFNVIAGVFPSDGGAVYFEGKRISGMKPEKICHLGISRTFQIVKPFLKMTVLENVAAGALHRMRSVSAAKEYAAATLDTVGLGARKDALPANLPLVLRKRLELARALATKPSVLLLDEVMSGLNPVEIREMLGLLQEIRTSRITLVVVEHIMHAIMRLCDRIIVLHHGEKIADGPPTDVAKDPQVIQAYLGEEYLIA